MKTLSRRDALIYAFSPDNPAKMTIDSGDTIAIETYDCFENQVSESQPLDKMDWDRVNPATGPIYINGAEPGDILQAEIIAIDIADTGVMVTGPGIGIMGHKVETMTQKSIPIKDGFALFDDKVKIPLNKMVGVIGVAPKEGSINCGVPDQHGGNMDTKLIKEGATLYLPIFQKGALFALGDLHAAMGDGEIGVSGFEIEGKVTVKLTVIKGKSITDPVIELPEKLAFLSSKETLDEAIKTATDLAVTFLHERSGLSIADTTMLMSAAGDAEICQIVDPLLTARFVIPRYILEAYGIEGFIE